MAYDFHYTPTGTGVISGKEVLEQTEDAINDLGNTAISGVQEALDKAEQALTNSENAVDDAQTALNTANNAEGVAIQAQTDVGNLSGTVTNIGNRVTTAEGNISNLQGRMTTAEGNITNLQGRMTTAETNIGNLQTAVSTAQATANSAQQTATTARQQSYVFRYSGTAITDNSTIAYSTIDNTDNIKSGDKILDVDGKLFEITAIDTTNQTVTVGTALIDLALDANVVHTSGDETVGGVKTFSSDIILQGTTTPVIKTISNIVQDTSAYNGSVSWVIRDKDDLNNILESALYKYSAKSIDWQLKLTGIDNGVSNTKGIRFTLDPVNNVANFIPTGNNTTSLGNSGTKWKDVYATNYYYGSDNVEFSTKFVTTDTNQTISGNKTFSSSTKIYNSDSTADTPNLILQSSKILVGDRTSSDTQSLVFNGGPSWISRVDSYKDNGGTQNLQLKIRTKDNDNNLISSMCRLRIFTDNTQFFEPEATNVISLGRSGYKWKDVQTNLVNGLAPSSLSLPENTYIDISGYITDFSGGSNLYRALDNGIVAVDISGTDGYVLFNNDLSIGDRITGTNIRRAAIIQVRKNDTVIIQSNGGTLIHAKFYPCQGNV